VRLASFVLLASAAALVIACGAGPGQDAGPPLVTVTLSLDGHGHGRVAGAGLDCGTLCTVQVARGSHVSLRATPAADSDFVAWGGALPGSAAPAAELQVLGDTSIRARFERAVDVRVSVTGTGHGQVSGASEDCLGSCTTRLRLPTTLNLTAHPELGTRFDGWTGACAGTRPDCQLELDLSAPAQVDLEAGFRQAHRFSRNAGGPDVDSAEDVAVSATGDVAAVGHFSMQPWIAVYAANGSVRFERVLAPTEGHAVAEAVAFDAQGNLFVAGSFGGRVDFGGGPLESLDGEDVYVASFTPDGQHRFSRRFGGAGPQRAVDLAIASSGELLLVGEFEGTLAFDRNVLVSSGRWDAFLAELAPDGSPLRAQRFGGPETDDQLVRVVPGPDGGVLALGSVQGSVRLECLDRDGESQWSHDLARDYRVSSIDHYGLGLGVTPTGEIVVAVPRNYFSYDAYLARYTPEGVLAAEMDLDHLRLNDLVVDHAGDIVLVGEVLKGVDLGGGELGKGIVLAKLDRGFGHRWSLGFDTPRASQTAFAVAVGPDGTIAMGGENIERLDFGGGPLGDDDRSLTDAWLAVFNH
jgi:Divergent InlB B-repeat domain